ncbi:MAG: HEAT repeat domain-containing protein [Polyangia bacterium]
MPSSILGRSGSSSSRLRALLLGAALTICGHAYADRIDDLARSLSEDSSYKVRVQAALVLAKSKDPRAVAALSKALKDENPTVRGTAASALGAIGDPSAKDALQSVASDSDGFVRSQVAKALAMLGGGGSKKGQKFYLAIGFSGAAPGNTLVRDALARELQKLPDVALSGGGPDLTGPAISQRNLQGFVIDGAVQRLNVSSTGGGVTIDCDLKAFVATYPGRSIKMMTTQGASLDVGASERESGKKDCIQAAAEAIRDDVSKYLKTVP